MGGGNRLKIVKDRERMMRSLCEGKDVLNVGCVGEIDFPRWLHEGIHQISAKCVGVDINREGLQRMKKMGYDVIYGDAETVDLNRKFDVIVAGELIEHVSNQGIFLDNMRRHLKDDGIMILSTPNALSLVFTIWRLLRRKNANISPYHTAWHCERTLKTITERHGWEMDELAYLTAPTNLVGKLFVYLVSRLSSPKLAGEHIIAVLSPRNNMEGMG